MSAGVTNGRKRLVVGLLVLLFSSTAAFAQESDELKRCMGQAETQLAIHKCASDEAGRLDAELNSVYKRAVINDSCGSDCCRKDQRYGTSMGKLSGCVLGGDVSG